MLRTAHARQRLGRKTLKATDHAVDVQRDAGPAFQQWPKPVRFLSAAAVVSSPATLLLALLVQQETRPETS